jgi:4'-phosphopantetheinyl transferase
MLDRDWADVTRATTWPVLHPSDLHILRARIPATPITSAITEAFFQSLSADERARVERQDIALRSGQFVLSRGLLRLCLSRYQNCSPNVFQFETGHGGKPALTASVLASDLTFNVSHSGDWIVIAIARAQSVGVDIEKIRERFDPDALASRYFSAREVADLGSLSQAERGVGFFNAWTRKEAYLKALGAGLQLGLASFSVTLRPQDVAAFTSGVDVRWQVVAFSVAPDMPGAIVFERTGAQIGYYDVSAWLKTD